MSRLAGWIIPTGRTTGWLLHRTNALQVNKIARGMHHEKNANLGERGGFPSVLLKLVNEHQHMRNNILQARPKKMPHFQQQNKQA